MISPCRCPHKPPRWGLNGFCGVAYYTHAVPLELGACPSQAPGPRSAIHELQLIMKSRRSSQIFRGRTQNFAPLHLMLCALATEVQEGAEIVDRMAQDRGQKIAGPREQSSQVSSDEGGRDHVSSGDWVSSSKSDGSDDKRQFHADSPFKARLDGASEESFLRNSGASRHRSDLEDRPVTRQRADQCAYQVAMLRDQLRPRLRNPDQECEKGNDGNNPCHDILGIPSDMGQNGLPKHIRPQDCQP